MLHCIAIAFYYIIMQSTVWHSIVLHGVVSCLVVSYLIVMYRVVSCCLVSYCIVLNFILFHCNCILLVELYYDGIVLHCVVLH